MAKTTIQKRPGGEWAAFWKLLPYFWMRGQRGMQARVVIALACLVLAKISNVFIPIFYGRAVDALSLKPSTFLTFPLGLILAYGFARILSEAFNALRLGIFEKVNQRAIRNIALSVFKHLHALSLRFHLERQTGGLSRAIERGTQGIDNLLSFALFNIVPTFVELLLTAGILWKLFNATYALITVATVLLYTAYTFAVSNWRMKIRRKMNDNDRHANSRAIDSLLNYETVKYFANEDHEARRYDESLAKFERASVRVTTSLAALNSGQALIISVGLTLIMLLAARDITQGHLSIGDFVLINTYLLQLADPLGVLGWAYTNLKQSLVDMEAMFKLLAIPPEVVDQPGAQKLHCTKGAVSFNNVSFAYDIRRPILKDVSFTIPSGHTLAVVGPTGAGKSTLSRLLFRFYDASEGTITIDGHDMRDLTQSSVRHAIGIVPQDTVLFNDTIYYNIAYGKPGATRQEVEKAACMAHIDGFIAQLPDGYETIVGERGLKLSGGEKQRVAIARALLKNPPIMVFDEATSALDTATEREIQSNLREAAAGRTTLIVAHRLSTVIEADEILVLDDGRIVERGNFASLLQQDGIFAAMWQKQQKALEQDNKADKLDVGIQDNY